MNSKKSMPVALTSAQIRAARGLVRWSAEDLAREARLGLATIRRAEQSENLTSLTAANDLAVRNALEAAGVDFIEENGGGPGVRLRKRIQSNPGKSAELGEVRVDEAERENQAL
jgi:transcriptional regulator with XRE-family HTH domain